MAAACSMWPGAEAEGTEQREQLPLGRGLNRSKPTRSDVPPSVRSLFLNLPRVSPTRSVQMSETMEGTPGDSGHEGFATSATATQNTARHCSSLRYRRASRIHSTQRGIPHHISLLSVFLILSGFSFHYFFSSLLFLILLFLHASYQLWL